MRIKSRYFTENLQTAASASSSNESKSFSKQQANPEHWMKSKKNHFHKWNMSLWSIAKYSMKKLTNIKIDTNFKFHESRTK